MRTTLLTILLVAWAVIFFALPAVTVAGDFYPVYHGASTLLAGKSPYSAEAVAELQRLWPTPHAATGYSYPLPLAMVVAPLALLPLPLATAIWLLAGAGASLAVLRLHSGQPEAPFLLLLFMPLFDALWARQVSLLWFGLIVLLLLALRQRHAWLAGLCIALLPIKPQIGLLFALYGLIIGWREDRRILAWSLGLGLLLWGGSLVLMPSWPMEWLAGLRRYEGVNPTVSMLPWSLILVAVTWHMPWPARLAAAQVALFPLNAVYTLLPLLLIWLHIGGRLALIGAALSWLYLPLIFTPLYGDAFIVWLLMGIPAVVGAYLHRKAGRSKK